MMFNEAWWTTNKIYIKKIIIDINLINILNNEILPTIFKLIWYNHKILWCLLFYYE